MTSVLCRPPGGADHVMECGVLCYHVREASTRRSSWSGTCAKPLPLLWESLLWALDTASREVTQALLCYSLTAAGRAFPILQCCHVGSAL
jgi:hypothetical protein